MSSPSDSAVEGSRSHKRNVFDSDACQSRRLLVSRPAASTGAQPLLAAQKVAKPLLQDLIFYGSLKASFIFPNRARLLLLIAILIFAIIALAPARMLKDSFQHFGKRLFRAGSA